MPDLRFAPASPVASPPVVQDGSSLQPFADAHGLSFTIGQDAGGSWVALESRGIAGGLFRNRDDALHYAGGEIRNGAGEIRFATGPVVFTVGR